LGGQRAAGLSDDVVGCVVSSSNALAQITLVNKLGKESTDKSVSSAVGIHYVLWFYVVYWELLNFTVIAN